MPGEAGGRGGSWLRAAPAVLAAAVLAACASSALQRHVEAGRYHEAMEAFRADSSLREDEDGLYRAGLLYASPSSPYYDPQQARETFETLLRLHPDTGRRQEVRRLVDLLEEIQGLGHRVTELRSQIDRLKAVDPEEPADAAGGGSR